MTKIISWQEFEYMDEAVKQATLTGLGEAVGQETAVFQHTTDMLSYHNQLASLIHLLQTAHARLKAGKTASEWQLQTVTALLMDALVFQYLESDPADSATAPPKLVAALQAIVPIEAEALNHYLAHLAGYMQYQWKLEHLAEHPPQNMAALMIEFLAFAYKEEGVAYGRSHLIRQLLPTYFVERRTGQLNPHPLAPDSDTLQRFLAKLLNYDPVRPYPAAALYTLLPTWLRFLQARGLLTPADAHATLDDLASLQGDLHTFFSNLAGDEALATAVAQWPL